jgi:hypothetical protein
MAALRQPTVHQILHSDDLESEYARRLLWMKSENWLFRGFGEGRAGMV